MADVFISYAREDRQRAHEIADALEQRGFSVWWDREMLVGKSFSEVIEREIAAAKCVIVLWSEHSLKSRWVRNEAADGAARELLVPVVIDGTRLPLEFSHLHTANLSGWEPGTTAEQLEDLMSSVASLMRPSATRPGVAMPPPAAAPRPAPRSGMKPAAYISIAAIVVLLLLIVGWLVFKPKRTVDPVPVTDTIATTTTDTGTTTTTVATSEPATDTGTTVTETTPPTDTQPPPEPPASATKAVGMLMVGEKERCTAFLINADVAVTSASCTKGAKPPLHLRLGPTRLYPVVVQHQGEKHALLKAEMSPGRAFSTISRSRIAKPGDAAILLHYQIGRPLSATRCTVTTVQTDEIQYRCATGRGSQGGPLLSSDYALLGFHSGGVPGPDRELKHGVPASVFIPRIRPHLTVPLRPGD